MVGSVETPCHTRLPALNHAGSNLQPSVLTRSLTDTCLVLERSCRQHDKITNNPSSTTVEHIIQTSSIYTYS
jgi:hypothetical protein